QDLRQNLMQLETLPLHPDVAEWDRAHHHKSLAGTNRVIRDLQSIASRGKISWEVYPSLPPTHLVHPHRLFEALGHKLPAVGEEEAFAGAEATHRVRHQDLASLRLRGDAGGEDHGRPEEVAVFLDRLTGVEADAD